MAIHLEDLKDQDLARNTGHRLARPFWLVHFFVDVVENFNVAAQLLLQFLVILDVFGADIDVASARGAHSYPVKMLAILPPWARMASVTS
jgi:hypothetical protein